MLRQIPRTVRESPQEVAAAMDNGKDSNPPPTNSIHDSVVSHDQLADCPILIFWHYSAKPRMVSKTPDVGDDAPGQAAAYVTESWLMYSTISLRSPRAPTVQRIEATWPDSA